MKRKTLVAILLIFIALSTCAFAQKNEVGVLGGATFSPDFADGVTLQGVFAHRILDGHAASLYLELPVVGVLRRHVQGSDFSDESFSSIFFTPSAKVKIAPGAAVSPFFSVGGGFAHYSSDFTVEGGTFFAKETASNTTWAFQAGGGIDIKTPIPAVTVRAEVRDFVTGRHDPDTASRFSHHNVAAEIGFVFHF